MTWLEEYNTEKKRINDTIDFLLKTNGVEDLKKRFFKDFGCLNGLGEDSMAEFMLARNFHARIAKLNPELHDEHETTRGRCYHVVSCKCGYSEECDSGD